ncbi:FUSC family protein [Paenibacillus sp. An7]|uniref:FUSC family protein n=1 Tax=Paenibacillus sp. An7 TaxID=2689577 RepID=UPI0013569313|nr:FUSC family protein [Paenibacillus sp. An7]
MNPNNQSIPKTRTYIAQHLKKAFRINKVPVPWGSAVIAGLSTGIPLLTGIILHEPGLGMLATTGAFVNVYMRDETARQRFVKLSCILLGLAFSIMLGTLAGPSLLASAAAISFIGAAATFLCGISGVLLPAGYMFVLVCGMAISLPADPDLFAYRGLTVLLGGIPALLLCMIPLAFHRYGPEKRMLSSLYQKLATMLESLNTSDYPLLRLETGELLQQTKKKIYQSMISGRKENRSLQQIYEITAAADQLFWALVSIEDQQISIPATYPRMLRTIARTLPKRPSTLTLDQQVFGNIKEEDHFHPALQEAFVYMMDATGNPSSKLEVSTRSLKEAIGTRWSIRGLYHYTTIFSASMKMGLLVLVAYGVAIMIQAPHPSWVPIGCASVLIAATATASFYRGIQLMIGTCIGGLLASLLLFLESTGFVIVLSVAIMQFIIKTLAVKNYALAAVFITPISLLLVSLAHPVDLPISFVNVRIIDIMLGCSLGLAGMLVISPHSASKRLNRTFAAALDAQAKLLKTYAKKHHNQEIKILSNIVLRSLKRTSTLYDQAFNEITRRPYHVEEDFPILIRIQKAGYLTIDTIRNEQLKEKKEELLACSELLTEMSAYFKTAPNSYKRRIKWNQNLGVSYLIEDKSIPLFTAVTDLYQELL